ncbi:subtilisin-like serine protease [Serendipita sp. 396]|nr:subtilisin-like serine protease [Serendipita sp. 396]
MHRNPLGVSQLARLLIFSIAFHFVSTVAYVIPSSSTASSRRSTVGILDVDGPVREDGYIITFTSSTNATAAQNAIQRDFGFESVTHRYNTDAIKGVSGTFNPTQIERIQAAEFVESIERDAVGGVDALVTQYDAPWGLQRISQVEGLPGGSNEQGLNYQYRYDDSAGNGVDIYIVDSGINIGHMDFGGRARWGKTFGGYTPDIDGLGHGTHVAGTAGGNQFGVAKRANLIAVRVLGPDGNGLTSDCISAIQWVMGQAASSGRPSVINISARYPASAALDAMVTSAVAAGIHVIVSAGNSGTDASGQSPARVPVATTVGATTINDQVASYSNFGPLVDIFAPGTSIISTWIGSNTATSVQTGTSMAAPHVAGITAYLISRYGNSPPANLLGFLQSISPFKSLSNVPPGTVNQLVNNGAYTGQFSQEETTTMEETQGQETSTASDPGSTEPSEDSTTIPISTLTEEVARRWTR